MFFPRLTAPRGLIMILAHEAYKKYYANSTTNPFDPATPESLLNMNNINTDTMSIHPDPTNPPNPIDNVPLGDLRGEPATLHPPLIVTIDSTSSSTTTPTTNPTPNIAANITAAEPGNTKPDTNTYYDPDILTLHTLLKCITALHTLRLFLRPFWNDLTNHYHRIPKSRIIRGYFRDWGSALIIWCLFMAFVGSEVVPASSTKS